jgi:hypothetical protein
MAHEADEFWKSALAAARSSLPEPPQNCEDTGRHELTRKKVASARPKLKSQILRLQTYRVPPSVG